MSHVCQTARDVSNASALILAAGHGNVAVLEALLPKATTKEKHEAGRFSLGVTQNE
jgi:hypothetical protein